MDTSVSCSLDLQYLQTMHNKPSLQARCEEPIMTSDWVFHLLLLPLLHASLFLPAAALRALLERALSSNNTTTHRAQKDWQADG